MQLMIRIVVGGAHGPYIWKRGGSRTGGIMMSSVGANQAQSVKARHSAAMMALDYAGRSI